MEYQYSTKEKKKILNILTKHNTTKNDISFLIELLKNKLGNEYDTSVGLGNRGYKKELMALIKELPWHYENIKKALDDSN